MRYCSQCGRPVRDGEICSCQGGSRPVSSQRSVYGSNPRSVPGQVPEPASRPAYGPRSASVSKRSSDAVYNPGLSQMSKPITRENFFQRLVSLFTRPVEEINDMVLSGDGFMGLKLFLAYVVFTVIAAIIMSVSARNAVSGVLGGVLGNIISGAGIITSILSIIVNLITGLVISGLLLLFSKAVFCAQISFAEIFTIVESKAAIDGTFLLVSVILFSFSPEFSVLIFLLGQVYSLLVMILGYAEVLTLEGSKKLYSLLLTFISIIVICYVLLTAAVDSVKESGKDALKQFNYNLEDEYDGWEDESYE